MININTGFNLRSAIPLDSRDSFDTILAMTTFAESSIDEGHISYVKETDKYYKFNSTNDVDTTLGKWREYNGGNGSGEENKINSISVNGSPISIDENKNVDITVPTVTNDLTNDLKSSYDDAVTAKHTHENGTVLDGITAEKVETWDKAEKNVQSDWNETDDTADGFIKNKPTIPDITGLATETYVDNKVADYTKTADLADVATSGSYNDLVDKPTIPSLDGYAKTTDIPTKVSDLENDSNYLSSIPEEYVTETELNAKGYLTEHQDISGKVDKVEGKSLISDTEIARLASVDNYDDADIRTELANKADTTAIPSKVSVLENDSKYQTESDVTTTLSDYATKTYVGEQIANSEHLKREIVTVLPSDEEASDNIIYMLKVESATGNDKYQEYMKIDGTVQMVGDTSVDLSDYAKTVDIPTTVAELTDSADYAKKTDIPTTLPANGGNADTVNNHTVETNVPTDAVFTDTTYSDATQIEHGLMSVDDKKKLDELTKYTPDGTTITADEDGTLHGVAEVTVDDALSDTSTNPVQNKVVKAYVDKEISENVDFSTSTSKLLNDTVEAPLLVTNATVNLFSGMFVNQTFEGITYTSNGDGTYSVKGSRTGDSSSYTNSILVNVQKGKTYKVLGSKSTNISVVSAYKKDNATPVASSKDSTIFTADEDQINLCLYVPADSEGIIDEILKPMLTTDLSATYDDFVPYSGYDIKTCGKNLVDVNTFPSSQVLNGITFTTDKKAGTITLNGTATKDFNNHLFNFIVVDGIKEYSFGGWDTRKITPIHDNLGLFTDDEFNFDGLRNITNINANKKHAINCVYRQGQVFDNFVIKPYVSANYDTYDGYDSIEPYKDGGSVHIDSTTEFPLFGLRSFDGETNIISPGNVEVTYAKSDSGKAILDTSENKLDKDNVVNNQTTTEEGFALDARQANPNIDGTLAKQISDLNGSLMNNLVYGHDVSSIKDMDSVGLYYITNASEMPTVDPFVVYSLGIVGRNWNYPIFAFNAYSNNMLYVGRNTTSDGVNYTFSGWTQIQTTE